MSPKAKTLISIVVPVYNEEGNVQRLYDALCAVLSPLSSRYEFEFIFTDNHSEDLTFDLLRELARKDDRIRAYRFSRNFGFQRSILGGYRLARGAVGRARWAGPLDNRPPAEECRGRRSKHRKWPDDRRSECTHSIPVDIRVNNR